MGVNKKTSSAMLDYEIGKRKLNDYREKRSATVSEDGVCGPGQRQRRREKQ